MIYGNSSHYYLYDYRSSKYYLMCTVVRRERSHFYIYSVVGVCSIFLRVDRSTNEIYKPRALFSIKIFYKKYVFIYY
jgi:hypothetical protein